MCICRDIVAEYSKQVKALGTTIFELLSEALGLDPSYLEEMDCTKALYVMGQYYPKCPEPELTMGISKHTDCDFITILLQDQIGGLQVLHENHWVNVSPVQGALVVNIGDILHITSEIVYYVFLQKINGLEIWLSEKVYGQDLASNKFERCKDHREFLGENLNAKSE